MAHPDWLHHLLAIREADPEGHPYTWGLLMAKHGLPSLTGPRVKEVLKQYDAQVEAAPYIDSPSNSVLNRERL